MTIRHLPDDFFGYDHLSVRARSSARRAEQTFPALGSRAPRHRSGPELSGHLEVGHMKQVVSLRGHEDRLSRIEARHRELDERIKELGRRPHLTPHEQMELAEIKKHKLKAKDEIAALRGPA